VATSPFRDAGKKYLVFFPEAIEDWEEYADLLAETPFVRAIPVPDIPTPGPSASRRARRDSLPAPFASSPAPLRISPESIAVTVPDLEGAGPYLMREFSLRGIPAELRSGASLGSLPTAGCSGSPSIARRRISPSARLRPFCSTDRYPGETGP
jgi:hypothetical protein